MSMIKTAETSNEKTAKKSGKIIFNLNVKGQKIDWNSAGTFPYKRKMDMVTYEREKHLLQIELLKVQSWIQDTKQRVVIIFEGRDAAGKGGTIKRFMEHLNPRGAKVTLASLAGVDIPDIKLVELDKLDNLPQINLPNEKLAFATRRFDREQNTQIHMEDFA